MVKSLVAGILEFIDDMVYLVALDWQKQWLEYWLQGLLKRCQSHSLMGQNYAIVAFTSLHGYPWFHQAVNAKLL